MRVPSHPTQIRRMLESRLKLLVPTGPVLAASLVRLDKRCGQPTCRCHHGGPLHSAYHLTYRQAPPGRPGAPLARSLHSAYHLTYRQAGRTCNAYVPQDLLEEVRSWIQEHRRLKALTQEVSQLTLALIKGHVRHRRLRRGRP